MDVSDCIGCGLSCYGYALFSSGVGTAGSDVLQEDREVDPAVASASAVFTTSQRLVGLSLPYYGHELASLLLIVLHTRRIKILNGSERSRFLRAFDT